MKKALRIILPVLLIIAILLCTAWYLFVYDRPFTRDTLLSIARYSEEQGNHTTAAWFYNLAYTQSGNNDSVAIELAEQYKSIGNYTKAEYTLTNAIADGGGINLYIALSKTFVEQDKLLDAVNMLNNITDPVIKAELDKLRPQAPISSPTPGFYSQYIDVDLTSNSGIIYATHNAEYPSTGDAPYAEAFSLIDGENTIYALSIGENGLVSPLSISSYTVGGVVKEMIFVDSKLEQAIKAALSLNNDTQLFTNDLWTIQNFTVPKGTKDLTDLQYLSFLETLSINDFSGSDFTFLASLNNLTQLSISNTAITQETLTTIASLPQLKHLTLNNCSLSGIKPLENAKTLVSLELPNNALRSLDALSGLNTLKHLDLSHNAISNLSAISSITSLESLNIAHNALTTLAPLSSLTSLKELNAEFNSISDLGQFSNLTELTHLYLNNNQLSSITPLESCVKLNELNISTNTIKDISVLSGAIFLHSLDFSFNEVSALPDFVVECELVSINGSNNQLTSLDRLGGLQYLNTVNMDYNSKISSVKALADCPVLIEVNVYGTKVKDVSMLTEMNIIVNYKPV